MPSIFSQPIEDLLGGFRQATPDLTNQLWAQTRYALQQKGPNALLGQNPLLTPPAPPKPSPEDQLATLRASLFSKAYGTSKEQGIVQYHPLEYGRGLVMPLKWLDKETGAQFKESSGNRPEFMYWRMKDLSPQEKALAMKLTMGGREKYLQDLPGMVEMYRKQASDEQAQHDAAYPHRQLAISATPTAPPTDEVK